MTSLNHDQIKAITERAIDRIAFPPVYLPKVGAFKSPKLPAYYTIGVRFVDGHNVTKIYTYRVRKTRKVKHGDLLVADTERGPTIVAVVRIDAKPQDNGTFDYKFITQKVAAL